MGIMFVENKNNNQFGHHHLTEDWRSWLKTCRDEGHDLMKTFKTACTYGLDPCSIALELGGFEHIGFDKEYADSYKDDLWKTWANPPLINRKFAPRAWRVDTNLAQIYEIPNFLCREECRDVISSINSSLVSSTVTTGAYGFRTSRTCSLPSVNPKLSAHLDNKISRLIGVDPCLSDSIEGLRYDSGQYFKAHHDWFPPTADYYKAQTDVGGQRTWTVMIYLNFVELGGETEFKHIGRIFTPCPGLALCWNNLYDDGEPNHETLHEAFPVVYGTKYVITKWFRQYPGKNRIVQTTQKVKSPEDFYQVNTRYDNRMVLSTTKLGEDTL